MLLNESNYVPDRFWSYKLITEEKEMVQRNCGHTFIYHYLPVKIGFSLFYTTSIFLCRIYILEDISTEAHMNEPQRGISNIP